MLNVMLTSIFWIIIVSFLFFRIRKLNREYASLKKEAYLLLESSQELREMVSKRFGKC